MTKFTPISVLILAHKNSEILPQVLASVSWADEVMIFWSGTEKLAEFATVKNRTKVVNISQKIDDFAQLRNAAIAHAKNDWVFFVDSDEVVEELAQEKIEKILLENANVAGISLQRKDVFLGKQLSWGEVRDVRMVRLFRKNFAKFTRAVHEVVEVNGQVLQSDVLLTHYAHYSVSSFLEKVRNYSALEVQLRPSKETFKNTLELLVLPVGKFLYNYLFQLGFLDGWQGLIYAVMMGIHSIAVRAGLHEKGAAR